MDGLTVNSAHMYFSVSEIEKILGPYFKSVFILCN